MAGVREEHPELMAQAADACSRLLGITPTEVQPPRRAPVGVPESFRCIFGRRSVIATSRPNARALALEARALRELGERGVPVPKLLAESDDWIIVEDVGSRRMSRELNQANNSPTEKWLSVCLDGLSRAHAAGRVARLDAVFDPLREGRLDELVQMLPVLGGLANLETPEVDVAALRRTIDLTETNFIKHTASPAYMVLLDEPERPVVLIDWQAAGPGDPIEDLMTLLSDESLPDDEAIEARLLANHLSDFGGVERLAAAHLLGALYVVRRLVMILSYKGEDDWWDSDAALARDLPLVRAEAVARLVARGQRWMRQTKELGGLSDWLASVGRVATTKRPA
ncbi:MAG: phosphotransferase [Myxococcales bacterium]|nr:phosphotransferase [Myxococcales bacterium]